MNKIAVLDTGYASYGYEVDLFGTHGYRFELSGGTEHNREQKIRFAEDAVGILVRGTRIDEEALARMGNLKAIVRYGTGYENIDLPAAFSRGIRVANVQGYASHAVSDHALGLMFACIRGIGFPGLQGFGKPHRKEVFELHDKTLGIIGIGRIGSHFARKASPMFRQTLAHDPYQSVETISASGAAKSDLGELLEESQVISIHCNLTSETCHMLDGDAFLSMKNRPVIINTARGGVIHGPALLDALDSDRVHSAGLDVFEKEPPGAAERALIDHPLVIGTPHVAWYSDRAMEELQRRAAENLLALLSGRDIADEIKPGNT